MSGPALSFSAGATRHNCLALSPNGLYRRVVGSSGQWPKLVHLARNQVFKYFSCYLLWLSAGACGAVQNSIIKHDPLEETRGPPHRILAHKHTKKSRPTPSHLQGQCVPTGSLGRSQVFFFFYKLHSRSPGQCVPTGSLEMTHPGGGCKYFSSIALARAGTMRPQTGLTRNDASR